MIIAEVGRNHLGMVEAAYVYVEQLGETEVDGISFQIREKEYYESPEKKQYVWDMQEYEYLATAVKNKNKQFGMALADPSLVEFFESIDTDFYKVIRNDINNDELVSKLIATGKKIFISTGLSSEEDISKFIEKYGHNSNIILNHTQLSDMIHAANLSAIETMRHKYGCKVSYGSHCWNKNVLYMALCYKPSDIMFYVKFNDYMSYPDNNHAITLNEVAKVSTNLKILSNAIGNGIKEK
tara:strand:+ start:5398 stop:6114 length:717 start_codon:yes stop_codon:yes gene_type:complete